MIDLTFNAEIKEYNGIKKLVYNNDDYFATRIQKSNTGKYKVEITPFKNKRTLSQNNFLWGVVYPTIAEETGDSINEIHEFSIRKLLKPRFINVKGQEMKIPATTTKLSKVEFGDYIRDIGIEFEVEIPHPCESGYFCGKDTCIHCTSK